MNTIAITTGISLSEKIAYLKTHPAVLNRVIYSVLKGGGIGITLGILGVLAGRASSQSFSFASLLSPNPLAARLVILTTLVSPTLASVSLVAISCIIGLIAAITEEDFRIGNSSKCLGWKLGTMEPIPETPTPEQKLMLAQEYLWNRYFFRTVTLSLKNQEKQERPETARLITRIATIWNKCETEIRTNASNSDVDNYQFRQHNILYRAISTLANAYQGNLLKILIIGSLSFYVCSRLDSSTI